ncbi:MAG: pitrilysin family protein [Thermoanaerobaculia bacterium]
MKRALAAAALLAWLAISFSSSAVAQSLAVEKYKLSNGMTVILYPDHTLPAAVINIWYRVGSKDEPARRSGFAHLFEHLMFMGTERVPNGEFDRLMEASGGSNNASTTSDRTDYYSLGPASLLPTLLWLDAERLEGLPRAMDQKKVDLQRDVVLNELRQSYENQPYGRADLAIQQLLYPPSHPYHFPGIGTAEDLKAAVANDVKDFFATYYVPNNASLVVAGDFDPVAIKSLVEKLFGTLPRGAEPPRKPVPSARLDRVRRGAMYDKVQLPLVAFAYHTPPAMAPGDAECDLLAAVLAEGKSSRLYKRLVIDDKLASSVSAYNASQQLGSYLRIDVQARPDADLARVEKAVDEEVARLLKDGPNAGELAQRKSTTELAKLSALQRLEARADALNFYEDVWGEPNSFVRDLDRYRNATPASVLATARQVLTKDARVVYRVLPEQPKQVPSARDTRPTDFPQKTFRPTAPETFTLASGIPVEFWRTPELPLTRVTTVFRPDGALDASRERAGLASLMAGMLDEGAGSRDALAFGEAVAALGGSFSTGATQRSVQASLTILSRNFAAGLPLLADAVRRPRFSTPDFERVKRLTLDALAQSEDEAPAVADRVASRALFGDTHPYAWPPDGTPASISAITLERVRVAHATLVRPETATLLVASSLPAADVKAALESSFGDWKAAEPARGLPPIPAAYAPSGTGLRVYLVDRPDAPQTSVRFLAPSPRFADSSRVPLRLLGTILGGSFTSRLEQNLREKHGYVYHAGAGFSPGPLLGTFSAAAEVTAKDTGGALREFLNEFARLSSGDVTDEEAGKARGLVKNRVVEAFSGLSGIVGTAASYVESGAPFETLGEDLAAMQRTTAADLNARAKTAVALDKAVLVLVGDKATLLPQLEEAGLPAPIEVDSWGEKKKVP